ncbi:MAG: YdcF family protein [Sporolactobacillus sp.]
MLIIFIALAVFGYIAFLTVTVRHSFKMSAYNHGAKQDVIIVLGYPAKKNGEMSSILRERVTQAMRLYHEGIAKRILCAGGAAHNSFIEADVMAQFLMDHDVPEQSIIRERRSRTTFQNLANAKKMMAELGLHTAVIVSSPCHIRKASAYATEFGIPHTVEKSKWPRAYTPLGIAIIYLYEYTRMLVNHWRYAQNR